MQKMEETAPPAEADKLFCFLCCSSGFCCRLVLDFPKNDCSPGRNIEFHIPNTVKFIYRVSHMLHQAGCSPFSPS